MPFILAAQDRDAWLDPQTSADELEKIFNRPQGANLQAEPVAKLVPDGEPRVSISAPKQAELF
jgi:putative SOS response-associated peptidase YedK